MEKKSTPKSALLCSMCNHYLINPYRLPCNHTFCFQCLKKSDKIKNNKISCFSCNSKYDIPVQGIIGFESVSSSEILRERIYSKLNDDKKEKIYASDPNLNLSNSHSERPKSSGYSPKVHQDPAYQRYSKYNQPDAAPTTVRNIKRSRKSPSSHSTSFLTRRKNLGHKQDSDEEDLSSRSVLSDILSRRTHLQQPQKVTRERSKTAYEFPHKSKIDEAMAAEESGEVEEKIGSAPSSPTHLRKNIKGRRTFKNTPFESTNETKNNYDHLFENKEESFTHTENNFDKSPESPKSYSDYTREKESFWKDRLGRKTSNYTNKNEDPSSKNINNNFRSNKSSFKKSNKSTKFDFGSSNQKSSFRNSRFADNNIPEDHEEFNREEHHCYQASFDEHSGSREGTKRSEKQGGEGMHTRGTHFEREHKRPGSGHSKGFHSDSKGFGVHNKSLSSESLAAKQYTGKDDRDQFFEDFDPTEPTKQSRNFLDRYNNPDMFNKRILRMRLSRLRYDKIMDDANLDESLLLSEEEKENEKDDSVKTNQADKEDVNDENIDPNKVPVSKTKKNRSKLTEEELKVNGRSLLDVTNASRKKYSIYMEEEVHVEIDENGNFIKKEDKNDENEFAVKVEQIDDLNKCETESDDNKEIIENKKAFDKKEREETIESEMNGKEEDEDMKEERVREKLQMVVSDGVVQRWKVEKNDFGIPTSVLIVQDVVVVADYGLSCLEFYDSGGNLEHKVDGVKPFCLTNFPRKPEKIMVADRKSKGVRVFDKYGSDVEQWDNMSIEWMSGIGMLSSGRLCVLDRARCKVSVLSADGTVALEFGSYGNNQHQLCMADFLVVDSTDRIIIADSGNHCIKVFDCKGKFLARYGGKGSEDGQLSWPKGITVDGKDNIIVADSNNNRISCFSPEGMFIRHFIINIDSPYNLHFESSQNLLAVVGYSMGGTSFSSLFHVS